MDQKPVEFPKPEPPMSNTAEPSMAIPEPSMYMAEPMSNMQQPIYQQPYGNWNPNWCPLTKGGPHTYVNGKCTRCGKSK